MDQLKPQDAQFLYIEGENNLTHVTSLMLLDPSTVPGGGPVQFKDIIAHIRERVEALPILKRKLAHVPFDLDYPYWVEDEYFDLEYHISHGRLPKPGDWRQFCIHMARYHSRPLDMNRPLWDMYVVEGLDNVEGVPAGTFALITKMHHAAVDGASMMKFFSALADLDPAGTMPILPIKKEDGGLSPTPPPFWQMMSRAASSTVKSPVKMMDAVTRAAPGIYRLAQKALKSFADNESSPVPETRFNAKVSPHKMFDGTSFPLADFKKIRTLVPGCTINDVVLAVISGGLRRYLQHHNELPDKPLIAWVPINARPGGAADMTEDGNKITAMTAPLATDRNDPVDRLHSIYSDTSRAKEAKTAIPAQLMTDLSQHAPAATQILASRLLQNANVAANMCNLFVSNVPGPQIDLYMMGSKVLASYGLAPLADGMGLFIATPSFAGKFYFGITSSREILPDIRFFVECIEQSAAELLAIAEPSADKEPSASKEPSANKKPPAKSTKTATKTTSRSSTRAKAPATKAKAAGANSKTAASKTTISKATKSTKTTAAATKAPAKTTKAAAKPAGSAAKPKSTVKKTASTTKAAAKTAAAKPKTTRATTKTVKSD